MGRLAFNNEARLFNNHQYSLILSGLRLSGLIFDVFDYRP